ncbi:MAG: S8 family serine peptidase, partial [Methanomicrobiales archaeon]|nr:S8 family serine peptidase [Methanomicrobiales archaeon]
MANKAVIFTFIIFILCIGMQVVLAVPDVSIPGISGVVKPPDVVVPSGPSLVKPVSPVSVSPVHKPVSGIVSSPVMSGASGHETEAESVQTAVATQNVSFENRSFAPDRVIVKYKTSGISTQSSLSQVQIEANAALGASVIADATTLGITGMQVVSVPNSTGTEKAIQLYKMNPMVEYAQPDYIYHAFPVTTVPVQVNQNAISYRESTISGKVNEPSAQIPVSPAVPVTKAPVTSGAKSSFVTVNLSNYDEYTTSTTGTSGQTATMSRTMLPSVSASSASNDPYVGYLWGLHNTGQTGGTADADIDAPEAWAVSKGSRSVIVGVVDTGVDYNHPDLKANMIGGYNAITGTTNPMDDNGHGTHCAGTIGAVGNNGIGVAGVNWYVRIMPLKFLDSSGSGYTSDAIEAFAWGYARGVRIFSNSWGGDGTDTALQNTINQYSDALFICAAGNDEVNTDVYPQSPSALPNANILSVAATDNRDALADFSNYGAKTVDVAAPGVSIYSTYRGGSYGYMSGTSMATPHVAGIAALVKAVNSGYTVAQVKQAILSRVDIKSGLSGKCVTGGRVNAIGSISSGSSYDFYVGDFNGDGKNDIASVSKTSSGYKWYLDYSGDGGTDKSFIYSTSAVSWDNRYIGDFNGDGKDDIALVLKTSSGYKWYLNYNCDGV